MSAEASLSRKAEPENTYGNFSEYLRLEKFPMPNGNSTYHYYGVPVVTILSLLLIIIMITALVGNTLVIITILRNKCMRTRTNILLCNLAVADILTALLNIPVSIHTLNYGTWTFSPAFCAFNGYLVGLGLMLSIHTLMWISIHKFISITRPLSRSMTPGKIFCMILAAWAWALLYNLGPVLGWTKIKYKRGASQCGPVIPKTTIQMSHSATNTIFNFFIPVCVMSYCYYKIFTEVKEHMNRLQDFSDTRVISTIMQQRRITKTLLIVFVCFLMCWSPYIVYSSLLVALGQENVSLIFNPVAYLATYLNSACNPIIYALRSPSFRKGFREILFCYKRMPAQNLMPQATRNIKLVPQAQFVFEDRSGVAVTKENCDLESKNEKSVGFLEGRNSLTVSSRNQSVSSTSRCFPDSPLTNGSFRWSRMSGFMISFRRSFRRTRSNPEVTSINNGRRPQLHYSKYPASSIDLPPTIYKHRRINTVPKGRVENNEGTKLAIEPSFQLITQECEKPLQLTNSITSVTSPKPPPIPLLQNDSATSLSPNEKTLLKLNDVFIESPSKEKKYFIYFSMFLNRPLSFSAPALLMNTDFKINEQEEGEHAATDDEGDDTNTEILLEVPQISYSRACSDGNFQPLLKSNSHSHSQFYRREVPKLLWQASLEHISVGVPRIKRTKYAFHRPDTQEIPSSRTLGVRRPSRIPSLLSSVECLITNIFRRGSTCASSNHLSTNIAEQGSRIVYYTEEEDDEPETKEPNIFVSHL